MTGGDSGESSLAGSTRTAESATSAFSFPVPEMVDIAAGEFEMGDSGGDGMRPEGPVHTVRIERPFRIGKYPITFSEFDAYAAATNRGRIDDNRWGRGRQPVIWVSWGDTIAYAGWLSRQTGGHYRLPSEASTLR